MTSSVPIICSKLSANHLWLTSSCQKMTIFTNPISRLSISLILCLKTIEKTHKWKSIEKCIFTIFWCLKKKPLNLWKLQKYYLFKILSVSISIFDKPQFNCSCFVTACLFFQPYKIKVGLTLYNGRSTPKDRFALLCTINCFTILWFKRQCSTFRTLKINK